MQAGTGVGQRGSPAAALPIDCREMRPPLILQAKERTGTGSPGPKGRLHRVGRGEARLRGFWPGIIYAFLFTVAAAFPTGRRALAVDGLAPNWAAAAVTGRWTPIGPDGVRLGSNVFSGSVSSIAIQPGDPNVIYIAIGTFTGVGGGVWKTTDGGVHWKPLTDRQCTLALATLAIDRAHPQTIYAGAGKLPNDCGMLRSTDGGTTWTPLGATANLGPINNIFIVPKATGRKGSPAIVVTSTTGVFRSTDGGRTWTMPATSPPGIAAQASQDPTHPEILYAALALPSNQCRGAICGGVYRSADSGLTWSLYGGKFPAVPYAVAVAPSAPSKVYVLAVDPTTYRTTAIYQSTGGAKWSNPSASACFSNPAYCGNLGYATVLTVDPANADILYFGDEDFGTALYRSTDGGATASVISPPHADQHALVVMPHHSNILFAGCDGGIFKSTDSGAHWTSLNNQLQTLQFNTVDLHPTNPLIAIGGMQDNGTAVYTGSRIWTGVFGADTLDTFFNRKNPTIAYANETGPVVRITDIPKTDQVSDPLTAGISGNDVGALLRFAVSPSDPNVLYSGGYQIYKSTNGGSSWSARGPSGRSGVILAIGLAASDPKTIYFAGSDDAYATSNGGASWRSIANPCVSGQVPSQFAVDPTNARSVFLVCAHSLNAPIAGNTVQKSSDGGGHWTSISGNLPAGGVNAIVLDPTSPEASLYVGTDKGVYRTTNGGKSWTLFGAGLPNAVVKGLAYNSTTKIMAAATYGRSVWVIKLGS